jgi:hypothetical protein
MKYNKHTIVWEKWHDPFGMDDDNTEFLDDEEVVDDEDNTDTEQYIRKTHKEVRCRFVVTPFGAIPYTEFTASGKIFNFWTGHTNFALTDRITNVIENTDGVETLDVFTKYRFRISVGKAFNDSTVMRNINEAVYNELG